MVEFGGTMAGYRITDIQITPEYEYLKADIIKGLNEHADKS